jgi:hypothetical protein
MAWPPPVLPINRTNATPQLDTHAADHNAVNQAVNDLVVNANGTTLAFAAQVAGLGASSTARFRMWSAQVAQTTDLSGAVDVTIPAGTFALPPAWVAADDFYVAGSDPALWSDYKVDGSVVTATHLRVVVAVRNGGVRMNTAVGFRVVAFGVWQA